MAYAKRFGEKALDDQILEAGISYTAAELIGKPIAFYRNDDAIVTAITAVRTTVDGFPLVEVSAKVFAGLNITGILLKAGDRALLLTTAREAGFREIPGKYSL